MERGSQICEQPCRSSVKINLLNIKCRVPTPLRVLAEWCTCPGLNRPLLGIRISFKIYGRPGLGRVSLPPGEWGSQRAGKKTFSFKRVAKINSSCNPSVICQKALVIPLQILNNSLGTRAALAFLINVRAAALSRLHLTTLSNEVNISPAIHPL